MSFVHASIVGHFDPCDSTPDRLKPLRQLDPEAVRTLLTSYDEEVAECVSLKDGYAWCEWSANLRQSHRVREFAERLADQEGCVVLETPVWWCRYPPEAAERQAQAFEAWRRKHGHS